MTTPAWTLRIVCGSLNVALTSAPEQVIGWGVSGPAGNATTTESLEVRRLNVTSKDIFDHLDAAGEKTNLFEWAKRFGASGGRTERAYVEWKRSGSHAAFRSPLLDGQIELHGFTLGRGWQQDALLATITWTRANYWEADSESELPLCNANVTTSGVATTGGLAIFNCADGVGTAPAVNTNWVKIAAADVTGDLPAPARVEFTNATAGTPRVRYVYAAHHALGDVDNAPLVFEAEDATGKTGSAEAGNSGGEYASYTLTNSEAAAFSWPLSAADVDALAGGHYLALIRVRAAALLPASTFLRLRLVSNSLTLWQQPHRYTGDTARVLQVVGSETIQIPPETIPAGEDAAALTLELTAERAAGGTFSLDFLALLPVQDSIDELGAGGYVRAEPKTSFGLAANATLLLDGLDDWPRLRAGTRAGGDWVPDYWAGAHNAMPFMLWPGVDQKLHFWWDTTDNAADIARAATVRVFYRPRRRGL